MARWLGDLGSSPDMHHVCRWLGFIRCQVVLSASLLCVVGFILGLLERKTNVCPLLARRSVLALVGWLLDVLALFPFPPLHFPGSHPLFSALSKNKDSWKKRGKEMTPLKYARGRVEK